MTNQSGVIDWPNVPPNPLPRPECPPEGQPIPQEVLLKLYEQTVQWQHNELWRKNYEINALRERVCTYHDELEKVRAGAPHSAFDVLLLLANDPTQPANVRLRAAEAIVQLERPKLSATVNTNANLSIAARLDAMGRGRLTLVPRDDGAVIEGGSGPTA